MSELDTLKLGEVRQIAWVVKDIEAAMQHWHSVLGVGPWFYKEKIEVTEFWYKGVKSTPLLLSIAFANSGSLQLELIQQRNLAPSMYTDFLSRCGDGMQHIAFWTSHFDQTSEKLLSKGYTQGHSGRVGQRGRFTYFVHSELPGNVVEISEQSGGKAEFFKEIATAAIDWNGSNPIRRVG
ncbi:MAG: VOC family protein [Limnohabitans sp.]